MSEHMKARPIKESIYLDVKVGGKGIRGKSYHIPISAKQKLDAFLQELNVTLPSSKEWDDATPWESLAKDRIEKYKKAGLVLRGARYRKNMSQVTLAQKSRVNQNEISKIENGKRTVGEKVAKRLAKVLEFDYKLLTELD